MKHGIWYYHKSMITVSPGGLRFSNCLENWPCISCPITFAPCTAFHFRPLQHIESSAIPALLSLPCLLTATSRINVILFIHIYWALIDQVLMALGAGYNWEQNRQSSFCHIRLWSINKEVFTVVGGDKSMKWKMHYEK